MSVLDLGPIVVLSYYFFRYCERQLRNGAAVVLTAMLAVAMLYVFPKLVATLLVGPHTGLMEGIIVAFIFGLDIAGCLWLESGEGVK